MSRSWMKWSVPALAMALVVAACDGQRAPTEPFAAPQYSHTDEHRLIKGEPNESSYTASKWIDENGGELAKGGHKLIVPAGAVSAPTLFKIVLATDGYVKVDLTAQQDSAGTMIDVGERGFATPVTLRLTYSWAEDVADPSKLYIVWVKEDGTKEPYASTVDQTDKFVKSSLDHFSQYAMAE